MKWTILGSGGCLVIPRPLCHCRVCSEAREKGIPYSRTGPSAFLHDINLLIDTPAESAQQLNRSDIENVEYLLFSHLDPDHVEGFRVVEQIALDFRNWRGFPEKQLTLLLPEELEVPLRRVRSQYGPLVDFYEETGLLRLQTFEHSVGVGDIHITAIPIDRGTQLAFVYVFEDTRHRVVYAPCDLKPFPLERNEVQGPNLLFIQPGIFETGLRYAFRYPRDHVSRTTLYTFEETLDLAARLRATEVVFVHIEEYWNRSYDDYHAMEADHSGIRFSYDGMEIAL